METKDKSNDRDSSNGLNIDRQWHLWFMLTIPFILLAVLIAIFVFTSILFQEIEPDQLNDYIEIRLPAILAINHISVFGLLLYILKKNAYKLKDIGWRSAPKTFITEIIIGLGCGLALYLFKEVVYDSVVALVDNRTPTFTSLFNFHLDYSEIPMIAAATSLIFIEESIYRGFGLNVLESSYGLIRAVIISSIFFGFLHWGNGVQAIVYTFVVGVILAIMYLWRNKNLIPVTVAHGLYNLMVLLT